MISQEYVPQELVWAIFSDQGPRGGWREASSTAFSTPTMEKCLAAGNFGLMTYQNEVNAFLRANGLPVAEFMQQPEHEGCLKNYFILRVNKELWDRKIRPLRDALEPVTNLAVQALKGSLIS